MSLNLSNATVYVSNTNVSSVQTESIFARLRRIVLQRICALSGHDTLIQRDGDHVFLRCTSCGHETTGWSTDSPRPRVRFHGDSARHRIGNPTKNSSTK